MVYNGEEYRYECDFHSNNDSNCIGLNRVRYRDGMEYSCQETLRYRFEEFSTQHDWLLDTGHSHEPVRNARGRLCEDSHSTSQCDVNSLNHSLQIGFYARDSDHRSCLHRDNDSEPVDLRDMTQSAGGCHPRVRRLIFALATRSIFCHTPSPFTMLEVGVSYTSFGL